MSDNTPRNAGDETPGYQTPPPPPAYGGGEPAAAPPQYPAPQYGSAPAAYPAAPQYQAPGAYAPAPYAYPQQKTNVLAIVSLIASLAGIIFILPFIGSVAGVVTGHISLNQIKKTGEKGRGMALAGLIIGYVGVALSLLGIIFIIIAIATAAQYGGYRYGS